LSNFESLFSGFDDFSLFISEFSSSIASLVAISVLVSLTGFCSTTASSTGFSMITFSA